MEWQDRDGIELVAEAHLLAPHNGVIYWQWSERPLQSWPIGTQARTLTALIFRSSAPFAFCTPLKCVFLNCIQPD